MRIGRRSFALALLVGALGFTANWETACTSKPTPVTTDVLFQGVATQAALVSLLDAPLKSDATQAASFTWTTSGDQFSASAPLTLCWTTSATARAVPIESPKGDPIDLERITHPAASPPTERVGFLGALFSGVPAAYAGTAPLTGRGFFLVMSTSTNAKLVRVFTTNHDYTPDATVMKKLATAGVPITAVVTSAYFSGDDVAASGGPFQGNAVTFTMTP